MGGEDRQAARVEAARARERAEVEARRAVVRAFNDWRPSDRSSFSSEERGGAEQGTGANAVGVKEELRVSTGKKSGPKRGRPKKEGVRPWEAAGVSRRTWERRRKAGK